MSARQRAEWEADKAGYRAAVMGNQASVYRKGSRLAAAHARGYASGAAAVERDGADAVAARML